MNLQRLILSLAASLGAFATAACHDQHRRRARPRRGSCDPRHPRSLQGQEPQPAVSERLVSEINYYVRFRCVDAPAGELSYIHFDLGAG